MHFSTPEHATISELKHVNLWWAVLDPRATPVAGRDNLKRILAVGDDRPDTCAYCGADTWCGRRANRKLQCRVCKIECFCSEILFPPLGYQLIGLAAQGSARPQWNRAPCSVSKGRCTSAGKPSTRIHRRISMQCDATRRIKTALSERIRAPRLHLRRGPLYEGGPIWRIEQISPEFPR